MKVQNKVLYHISRENNWNVGDKITSGESENPFWNFCKNYSPSYLVNGQPVPIFKIFEQFSNFDVTQDNITFLYQVIKDVSKETAFCIREHVFEYIRKEFYPQLPSRQKCLWLTDADQLSYWKTMADNTKRSVLTLELKGDLFCGDDNWLTADTFSSVEYENRAKHYWAGEMTESSRKEYLFYGQALVTDITLIQ